MQRALKKHEILFETIATMETTEAERLWLRQMCLPFIGDTEYCRNGRIEWRLTQKYGGDRGKREEKKREREQNEGRARKEGKARGT